LKSDEKLLLAGGLFAFIYFWGSKGLAASNLVFYPGSVSGMSFNGSTPTVQFTMQVQNTSGTDLTINSFAGNIFSSDTLIGNVYNFTPVLIPAGSMAVITVNAQLNAVSIVNDIIRAFQMKNFSENLDVNATANVQGIQVPVNLSFNVGLAA
jgi:hypothetical protein